MAEKQVSIIIRAKDQASAAIKTIKNELNGIGAGLKSGLSGASGQFSNIGNAAKGAASGVGELGTAATQAGGAVDGLGAKSGSLQSMFTSLSSGAMAAVAAITAVVAAIGKIGAEMIGAASSMEQAKVRLEVMAGSSDLAAQKLDYLKQVAASVPFEFEKIAQSGTQLEAFGMNVETWMVPLTDLAAFMGKDLPEAASAMGKAFTGGAGAADVMREMGVLNEMARTLGITIDDLKDMTLPEFQKAMLDAFTDPSGKIEGMADKLGDTWEGKVSMMSDAWFSLMNTVAETGAFDLAKNAIDGITSVIKSLGDAMSGLQGIMSSVAAGFSTIAGAAESAAKSIGISQGSIDKFKSWAGNKLGSVSSLINLPMYLVNKGRQAQAEGGSERPGVQKGNMGFSGLMFGGSQRSYEDVRKSIDAEKVRAQYRGESVKTAQQEIKVLEAGLALAIGRGAKEEEILAYQKDIIALRGQEAKATVASSHASEKQAVADKHSLEIQKQKNALKEEEARHASEIADIQRKAEQAAAEAEAKGFKAGHSQGLGDQVLMAENMKKTYEDNLNLAKQQREEFKNSAQDRLEENESLQKQNDILSKNASIVASLNDAKLTDQQRVSALNDITRNNERLAQLTDKQVSNGKEIFDNETRLTAAYSNMTSEQARFYELGRDVLALDTNLLMTQQDRLSLMVRTREELKQLAEEFGMTVEQVTAKLGDLAAMDEKTLNSMRRRADFVRQERDMREQIAREKQFGISESSGAQELAGLYKSGLSSGATKDVGKYKTYQAIADVEADQKRQIDAAKQAADALAQQTHGALSNSILTAFKDGGQAGVKSLLDYIKNSFMKQFADGIASAFLSGGQQGKWNIMGVFGGGGGAGGNAAGAAAAAATMVKGGTQPLPGSSFATGWAGMANQVYGAPQSAAAAGAASGGKGGLLGKLLGGAGAGGAMPYIGAAMLISSFFKKGGEVPQSGVAPLEHMSGTTTVGGGLDVLRGSDYFQRGAFSSRNVTGDVSRRMMEPYMGGGEKVAVEVEVKPGPMFDAEVKTRVTQGLRQSKTAGVPRRTGFTHG